MLGLAGSIVGILLGILLSYGLIGFSEQFLQTEVGWNLQIAPVYSGLVVGIIATTVFGFLPILAASRVRPNVLLQPQASALPKAGRLISLFVVLLLTAVMGLVATVFLDDLTIAMIGTYGALAVLTLLTVILLGVVWLVGKVPSFGSINLKLSLRGLSRQKGRAASTLLALVIGVFAMGSIVILSGSMKQLVDEFAEDAVGGNILLMVPDGDPEITERASQAISSLQGVTNVVEDYEYTAQLVAVNGEPKSGWGFTMRARRGTATEGNVALADGRHLVPEDVGSPVAVVGGWGAPERLGLRVGDELTFSVGGEWVYDEFMGGQEVTLELVGITLDEPPAQGAFEGGDHGPYWRTRPYHHSQLRFFHHDRPGVGGARYHCPINQRRARGHSNGDRNSGRCLQGDYRQDRYIPHNLVRTGPLRRSGDHRQQRRPGYDGAAPRDRHDEGGRGQGLQNTNVPSDRVRRHWPGGRRYRGSPIDHCFGPIQEPVRIRNLSGPEPVVGHGRTGDSYRSGSRGGCDIGMARV